MHFIIFIFRFVFEQRYSCTRNISQYLNVLARHMAFGGPPETAVPCHFWDCTWAQPTNCSQTRWHRIRTCFAMCWQLWASFPRGNVLEASVLFENELHSSSSCDFRQYMAIYSMFYGVETHWINFQVGAFHPQNLRPVVRWQEWAGLYLSRTGSTSGLPSKIQIHLKIFWNSVFTLKWYHIYPF